MSPADGSTTRAGAAAAALRERVEKLRTSPGFRSYLRARDEVLAMLDAGRSGSAAPSEYWREELAGFDYLLDASPLVIDRLREHTHHVTGLRPYEYRGGSPARRAALAAKLQALRAAGGPELLVPESPVLGGFGFEIDGALYNLDTLKFYEALIALDRAGVLDDLQGADGRPVVWEIGAGWGGFAHQFKRLFPEVAYVILDLPELFLFSATYLMTQFPDAEVAFVDSSRADAGDKGVGEVDFAFVPNTALNAIRGRLDLVVNMVSFQEMTTEQVGEYVAHAARQGCPRLYSLNRARSLYNTELTSVHDLVAEHYATERIDVLDVPYNDLRPARPPLERLARRVRRADALEYRHIVGRLPRR